MKNDAFHKMLPTNDSIIRLALKEYLNKLYSRDSDLRIIEELGVRHGSVRIDIAVVNGILHGYEIKSDRDTLERLPEQMIEFNTVFDRVTLVVGKQHLYRAIHMIPDWWGIIIAKINTSGRVVFQTIREPENNQKQDKISVARLLWRGEALSILEEHSQAEGVRSKPREFVYKRLAEALDIGILKEQVRKALMISRENWRVGLTPISHDG